MSQSPPNVFNPWRDVDDDLDLCGAAAAHRWVRLTQHFSGNPRLLLVGEAPGYKGCRVSGVPFTSERQILAGAIPRVSAEGRMTKTRDSQAERTATMCWNVLKEFNIGDCVVMWNAFPWHPHEPGNSYSNRKGAKFTPWELARGEVVLRAVLALFPGVPIVPVGNVARETLAYLKVAALPSIRLPSTGGKADFRAGLRERLELLNLKMC